ncbi:MAG TPA: GMP reductase [Acidobacteriota bacterium]|nr:GMP reductase [Acidobacteriota bacterium]
MRIDTEPKLDYDDVLIRPKRSTLESRADVELTRTFEFYHSKKTWTGIPVMVSNMDSVGTFEMARALSTQKIVTCLHKFYSVSDYKQFFSTFHAPDYVAYSLGIRPEDFTKLQEMKAAGLLSQFSFIVLDVPNAYLESFVVKLRELRALCPEHIIVAGNCVTNEMAEELVLNGADIVKVGIGSGSACLTRRKTGVGYPQLSATIECSDAAHGISRAGFGCGLVVSDGGIVYPADVAKSICGGADFVMIGSLFAGHDETAGTLIERDGKQYKQFRGMSSTAAMKDNYGKKAVYRASEGRELLIPYRGSVLDFVEDLLGSLRSTGTYIGARKLKEFSKRATFIKVSRQLNTSLERFEK